MYKCIGLVSPLFRLLVLHSDLEALERKKKYNDARILRHKAFNTYNKKYLAPLWRQEGFDLLYQVKDYQLSLVAFQNAIETLELNAALYGIANPLDIYFGATIASVSASNIDKAKEYYQEFTKLFKSFSKNPKLEKTLKNYNEGISWIERHLSQHIEDT